MGQMLMADRYFWSLPQSSLSNQSTLSFGSPRVLWLSGGEKFGCDRPQDPWQRVMIIPAIAPRTRRSLNQRGWEAIAPRLGTRIAPRLETRIAHCLDCAPSDFNSEFQIRMIYVQDLRHLSS
ncbi:MAG: hypothetical protein ACRCU2_08610 [Planktothrix sp.]